MSNDRLFRENTTFWLAAPGIFSDIENPEADELNDAVVNGLAWNITCALNEDGTTFDLSDSDTDDTLTFCQRAGVVNPTFFNPEIVFEVMRSKDPTAVNQANTAFGLLAFPDAEYLAILRVGKEADQPVAPGDRLKIASVSTDYPVDVTGTGENIRLQQNFLPTGDVAWNVEVQGS